MRDERKFFCFVIGCATAIILFSIFCVSVNSDSQRKLIMEEPTCYGKVLLSDFDNSDDKIKAINACENIQDGE
jgi:hypothetical protein